MNIKPRANYPTYPPYHSGLYLEEYFFYVWSRDNIQKERKYLDIFWTNHYCNAYAAGQQYDRSSIEEYLKNLDPSDKYFTICQHDDAPLEEVPHNTKIFSAGGRNKKGNIIPIPLICGPIPEYIIFEEKKDILASFVGSSTHSIRKQMQEVLADSEDYFIQMDSWSNSVPMSNFQAFLESAAKSKFILAPRGYGPSSFRMYESFQMGCVPVYISDEFYLPWTDELNWKEFCVLIEPKDLRNIDDILRNIDDDAYNSMLRKGKEVYSKYFTLDGVVENILKRI